MSHSKSTVITLNFHPPALRWLLLLPALIAILGAWSAVRWYVGDTIAEYSPASDEGAVDMARMAVRWAPGDPLTHWRLASVEEKNFSPENLAAARQEYELAVQAAPYDYRYWMEYGRALEAAGDPDSGEKALRRAVELAPAYSHPRWFYGNLLLRQGKIDEAFAQLSQAAQADELMRPAIFSLVSQVFGSDLQKIIQVLPAPAVRLQFALGLINAGKFDDATRVLRTISAADRKAQSDATDQVLKTLAERKQFHAAIALMREFEPDGSDLPALEQIWNGDFKQSVPRMDAKPFRWVIDSRPQVRIAIDSHGHNDEGSLRLFFNVPNKLDNIPVSQTVIVEPDTQYRLQFYQRTEALTSANTPMVFVNDAVDGSSLATSKPVATGTNDWQLVTLDFRTKPQHEGILIGIQRDACETNQPICPIYGNVWYDNFNLQRLGAPSAARRAGNNSR